MDDSNKIREDFKELESNVILSLETEEDQCVTMKLGETMSQESVHKVLIDPSIPIEELLGSVTTYNSIEGSDMKSLRTSARVFKKMKMDSALAATPAVEKKEPEKKEEPKPEGRRPFTRPLWNPEDKNLFFEALNEYGKDFDAIHTYISTKLRKKGTPENGIKTKEQIRHLYYRTWHKISKHLKFSDEVKKNVQELYGLVNFGELRKKLTSISEKTCIKLNELIYRGSLAIRVKGKTIRMRTPMCKALRRLNHLDENNDDIKLPTRISVEMRPKDMSSWMRVQDISQNPRIKTALPLQKRLSTLLNHMSERWKSADILEHTRLLQVAEQISTEEEKLAENVTPRTDPPLRFYPPPDAPITVPTYTLSEFFTAHSISLNAYEERAGIKVNGEQLWLQAYPSFNKANKRERGVKRSRAESASEKNATKLPCSSATDNNENCVPDSEYSINKEIIDEAVNTILALQQTQQEQITLAEEEKKNEAIKQEEDMLVQVKREHDIAKIKMGWTLNECGTLTIGDLYLMFGSDSKVLLEYCWDVPEPVSLKKEEAVVEASENVEGESGVEQENSDNCNDNESLGNCNDLSLTLKRLLSIAKLHYRKNIVKCPCGHVCGATGKAPAVKKVAQKKVNNVQESKPPPVETQVVNHTVHSVITVQPNNITTTASMVPVILQPEIQNYSPSTLFRTPTAINGGFRAQLDSITRLKTKYCNRRGRRPRPKQVVVERRLSILANKTDSDRQIVTMNIVSTDISSTTRQIAPKIVPQITTADGSETNGVYMEASLTPVSVTGNEETGTFGIVQLEEDGSTPVAPDILDNATTPSRVGSPTSISNLLDMALRSHENNGIVLDNAVNKNDNPTSFVGLLSDNATNSSMAPVSPSRILKENENQWLNSEVADFSLSSFLGHLESPMKNLQPGANEDSRLSQDPFQVDAQLQSLLTESSMDLTAKFADLAARVTDNKK